MANSSFRLRSKTLYTIEVNDDGDTISIDIADPQLLLKFNKAMEDINNIAEEMNAKEEEIKAMDDEENDNGISIKELKMAEEIDNAFRRMRKAFDKFLGEGACQKIFGDSNYLEMFTDLGKALNEELTKIGVTSKSFEKEIIDKYGSKEDEII